MRTADNLQIPITSEVDIVEARRLGREMAAQAGFPISDQTLIATAISELARNIISYAQRGEVVIKEERNGSRSGVTVVARDNGPGISDPIRAMEDGFSTGKGLGLGLPGTKRIMDEFELTSEIGKGTQVTIKKWVT